MAWTSPRTWVAGELVTEAMMNTYIRDNQGAIVATTGAYVNAVVGPHAIGGATSNYVRLALIGAFTSGGASDTSIGTYHAGVLTGHSGDTLAQIGTKFDNDITTAGSCTTVAQLWVDEPTLIIGGGGTVTNSASVYIASAASEASSNYALWVAGGTTLLDGAFAAEGGAVFNDTSGDADFRVESADNANAINVDAGLNTLGIFRAADLNYYQTIIAGSFTSGGASSVATGLITETAITAHSGDTTRVTGQSFTSNITTPAASMTVALAAQTYIAAPTISLGSGSAVTNAASLYILDAPGEAATGNFALWVDSGATKLDGYLFVGQDGVGRGTFINESWGTYVGNNTYYNGSNWIAVGAAASSKITQSSSNAMTFSQAASVSAGATASFIDAVTIGSYPGVGAAHRKGITLAPQVTGSTGGWEAYGVYVAPIITEAASDTHGNLIGMLVAPTITNASGTTTTASGLAVNAFAAPSTTTNAAALKIAKPSAATNNYGMWVTDGSSGLAGMNASADDIVVESNGGVGMTFAGGADQNGVIAFGDPDSNYQGLLIYDHSSSTMKLGTSGSVQMIINSTGKVAIGTTDTDGLVHIQSASAGSVSAHANADELVLENSAHAGMTILAGKTSNANIFFGDEDSSTQGQIYFTNNETTASLNIQNEFGYVNLLPSGGAAHGVGIGVSDPDRMLHIKNSGAVYAKVESSSNSTQAGILFKTADDEWEVGLRGDLGDNLGIWCTRLGTAAVLVTQAANVGIGTGGTQPNSAVDLILSGFGVQAMKNLTSAQSAIGSHTVFWFETDGYLHYMTAGGTEYKLDRTAV